jgi:hypothetical protein
METDSIRVKKTPMTRLFIYPAITPLRLLAASEILSSSSPTVDYLPVNLRLLKRQIKRWKFELKNNVVTIASPKAQSQNK